jgi:Raf kinase inhibitor-like YbhB/YbcL family protein
MMQQPITLSKELKTIKVTSDAFLDRNYIPIRYTCDGINVNPPFNLQNVPEEAKSLVLIVDDPDAPVRPWVHWIVWNITPSAKIKENSIPGIEGMNDFNKKHYGGPCPHSGTHRYFFKVYALDENIVLSSNATKDMLEKAISTHLIGFGELIGLYKRVL